jgi:hypothetical protein
MITSYENPVTTNVYDQVNSEIYLDYIVWEDKSNNHWDIYLSIMDADNDGITDCYDEFPSNPFDYMDSDGDGLGDSIDPDSDGDGYDNGEDDFPTNSSEWIDTDLDTIGNNADTDDDNDGVADIYDPSPLSDVNVLMAEVDRTISRIEILEHNLTDQLDEIEVNMTAQLERMEMDILGRIDGLNTTMRAAFAEQVLSFSFELASLERSITSLIGSVWMDMNTTDADLIESFRLENELTRGWIINLENNLTGEIADLEEYVGLMFDMMGDQVDQLEITLRSLVSNLNTALMEIGIEIDGDLSQIWRHVWSLYENDTTIRGDLRAIIADLSDLETTLLALAKLDSIIADMDDLSTQVQGDHSDIRSQQESQTTLLWALIVLAVILIFGLGFLIFDRIRNDRIRSSNFRSSDGGRTEA